MMQRTYFCIQSGGIHGLIHNRKAVKPLRSTLTGRDTQLLLVCRLFARLHRGRLHNVCCLGYGSILSLS